ncbi:AAA family ATPase [Veillonella sp. DNF00869]|uniref:AAA family ATPase n=1 Tax=Veillonella sp. DNF00869 TaxID=1384081 RepID=UPI000798450E|nr:AAA family ATPase [Veillonella sp. DNF00869]KXB86417.1 hypothetical protein HMPREF3032_01527 [Veillonella sp. DNF00869]
MNKLIFKKIKNENIFAKDYDNFIKNNEIEFSDSEIAVVYGPNGTGKTSLVKALANGEKTAIQYSYNGKEYNDDSQFIIINDQNNRNIIKGETSDFLLGDDIKREHELYEYITNEYETICTQSNKILKDKFKITSGSSKLITYFSEKDNFQKNIQDLANNKSKGKKTKIDDYIVGWSKYKPYVISEYDEAKLEYFMNDLSTSKSLILEIESIDTTLVTQNTRIREVEKNTEAIRILSHFCDTEECIVCDSINIGRENLLAKKTKNKNNILETLEPKIKDILEKLSSSSTVEDPFNIKNVLIAAIETGELEGICNLKDDIQDYRDIFVKKVINELLEILNHSDIRDKNEEYKKLINEKPEINDEDFLYIEEIINNSMFKKIRIGRDDKKNIQIFIEDKEFLGIDREELPLSSGEQNFLSLTLEFLKAKNSDKPIVILDDPISSFDSIYKNKIVYAIIKILDKKKRVILTHNVDLLRLLDGQLKKCFNLFLFNNTENEENGFIPLKPDERDMLISLDTLLKAFRTKIYKYVKNKELFLISLIPFMRGYATIINNEDVKENLTQVMHGFKDELVDIGSCYQILFGKHDGIHKQYEVSVDSILNQSIEECEIVDNEKYPLLNRTLRHSFIYLYLRLLIEKVLVSKYKINTEGRNGAKQLGQIISKAFPDSSDKDAMKKRVFLTTKKTLLNEFNHFEGNLSIFQPAIDITNQILEEEAKKIINFLKNL